jgi:prolipoprotein diacylglyceryltransferase
MLYLGCVAGVYVGAAVAGESGLDESQFALITIGLLLPAMVGARAWFVVRHLDLYRHEPRRIAARAEGGAALFGGLAVGVVVSVPVLAVGGLAFWTFWDAAIVTMLVGLIVTRFGCLLNGCCAGRPTDGRLGLRLPNVGGRWQRRYPTQLLEAAFGGLVLAGALTLRHVLPFDGALFLSVVALYCAARLVLEPMREDVGAAQAQPHQASERGEHADGGAGAGERRGPRIRMADARTGLPRVFCRSDRRRHIRHIQRQKSRAKRREAATRV